MLLRPAFRLGEDRNHTNHGNIDNPAVLLSPALVLGEDRNREQVDSIDAAKDALRPAFGLGRIATNGLGRIAMKGSAWEPRGKTRTQPSLYAFGEDRNKFMRHTIRNVQRMLRPACGLGEDRNWLTLQQWRRDMAQLRSAFGLGEDRNACRYGGAGGAWKLRPAFGLGEDRNSADGMFEVAT